MCLSGLLLEIISLDSPPTPVYVCENNQNCESHAAIFSSYQARSLTIVIQTLQVINDFYFYPLASHRHDPGYLYIEIFLGNFPSVSSSIIPFKEQSIFFPFLHLKIFLWTTVTQGYMTKDFSAAVTSHRR